jgi:hypothetical protein
MKLPIASNLPKSDSNGFLCERYEFNPFYVIKANINSAKIITGR